MTRRFVDKIAIVTGASTGIGLAAARMLAAEGAKVVLAARGAETLEREAAAIRASGAVALAVPTDVSDPAACAALVERTVAEHGGLDLLVNSAGKNVRGEVRERSPEELAAIVDVNLRAPIVLSCLAVRHMAKRPGAAIVNVASLAGRVPLPHEATYSATKFGLRAFTYAMADEMADHGVKVCVVSPGPVDTGFIMSPELIDDVPALVFSQPMSTAEEIAALVLESAADGRVERSKPRLGAAMATLGYLVPALRRAMKPALEAKGRRAKARYRARGPRS